MPIRAWDEAKSSVGIWLKFIHLRFIKYWSEAQWFSNELYISQLQAQSQSKAFHGSTRGQCVSLSCRGTKSRCMYDGATPALFWKCNLWKHFISNAKRVVTWLMMGVHYTIWCDQPESISGFNTTWSCPSEAQVPINNLVETEKWCTFSALINCSHSHILGTQSSSRDENEAIYIFNTDIRI